MEEVDLPKTPSRATESQGDESFRTCKDSMPTPSTRYMLRMTTTRSSILAGATPFKESKPPSLRANRSRPKNDTLGSNDTFIMQEQELMFDRDSLEPINTRFSSTPKPNQPICPAIEESPDNEQLTAKPAPILPKEEPDQQLNLNRLSLSKQPTFLKEKGTGNNSLDCLVAQVRPQTSSGKTRMSPNKNIARKKSPTKKNRMPPPPPPPPSSTRTVKDSIRKRFVTPRAVFRKPANLMGTASRYLSQMNSSKLTRSHSYKSTAELERDYFKSLRSF